MFYLAKINGICPGWRLLPLQSRLHCNAGGWFVPAAPMGGGIQLWKNDNHLSLWTMDGKGGGA